MGTIVETTAGRLRGVLAGRHTVFRGQRAVWEGIVR